MKHRITVTVEVDNSYDMAQAIQRVELALRSGGYGLSLQKVEQFQEPTPSFAQHFTSTELEKIGQIVQVMRTIDRMG